MSSRHWTRRRQARALHCASPPSADILGRLIRTEPPLIAIARHPRNHGFVWQDRPADPVGTVPAAAVAQFNRDGAVRLPGAVNPSALTDLVAEIDALEAGSGETVLTLDGGAAVEYAADAFTFTKAMAARSEKLRRFYAGALFQDLGRAFVGPDVRLYWDQAVYKKPKARRAFPFHQDNGYGFTRPQAYLTVWIALTDATADNGCLFVLPGLHRLGTLAHDVTPDGLAVRGAEAPEIAGTAIALPARAGDAVVLSSLTPHKSGPNLTARTRKALIVQLMPDGMAVIGEDGAAHAPDDPAANMAILKGGRAA